MSESARGGIALGVTGGIAAYKTAELARLLVRSGYRVYPSMTEWAMRFLAPLTLETLCGHPVRVATASPDAAGGIEHISLIRAADLLVIAPTTANTMAKMANGLADNFLTTTYLAHRGPVLACPAMNTAMLEHPATRRNLATLEKDGVVFCFGEAGDLACGETGAGRMAEPATILEDIEWMLAKPIPALKDKAVLVSAGPTCEDVDPVRYLTNRASGRMGVAVARAFRDAGAKVTLVHGPMALPPPRRVETLAVRSAAEMAERVLDRSESTDIVVMAAAVADYRPPQSAAKLKKDAFDGLLRLERTTDILAALGARKRAGQLLIGFAAETEALADNARAKLERKNLDLIFANDVSAAGLGFASERNRLLAIRRQGEPIDLGEASKDALARRIAEIAADALNASA